MLYVNLNVWHHLVGPRDYEKKKIKKSDRGKSKEMGRNVIHHWCNEGLFYRQEKTIWEIMF